MKLVLTALALTAAACNSQGPNRVLSKAGAPSSDDSATNHPEHLPSDEQEPSDATQPKQEASAGENGDTPAGGGSTAQDTENENEDSVADGAFSPNAFPPIAIAGGAHSVLPYRLDCSNEGTKYVCALQNKSGDPAKLSGSEPARLIFNANKVFSDIRFTTDEVNGGSRYHFTLPEGASGTMDLRQSKTFAPNVLLAQTNITSVK